MTGSCSRPSTWTEWAQVTFEERLRSKVTVVPGECWEWCGTVDRDGYGEISLGRKREGKARAHRAMYELEAGPVPDGMVLDHLCRNRGCVNPEHLEPVTNRENILRGEGVAAVNARKTHCLREHPLSGANLWVNRRGQRQCRTCKRDRLRAWREGRRAASDNSTVR